MKIDIITILYNSNGWLTGYLDALYNGNYPLANVNLYLIDNYPEKCDRTLIDNHPVIEGLASYTYVANTQNVGFGAANNQGVKLGNSPYVFFLNIDTALTVTALKELVGCIRVSEASVGAWEMRQFPYEHPKLYNPITQYTSWCSGAALCVKRSVFEEVGGFDERIFMYGEDVDLSWRIRSLGYNLMYCPQVGVFHFSYEEGVEVKPRQLFHSLEGNLILRYKYGQWIDILKGYFLVKRFIQCAKNITGDQKRELKKMFRGIHSRGMRFRNNTTRLSFVPHFIGLEYETMRSGAFCRQKEWDQSKPTPQISVIVRTHKRPLVLEEAIKSLINQTYSNIEIVVVEDGENTAQSIVDQYRKHANIQYLYSGKPVGRSAAGNLAMSKANGEYLAFLDDDDLVYADHFETLMGKLVEENYDAVHAPAFCVRTEVFSKDPYQYQEMDYTILHDIPFNKEDLIEHNLFPIQAVLFKKKFFDELGGFDTTIDYLEDWALWLKYFSKARVGYVDKVTSLYRVPAQSVNYKERQQQLLSTYKYVVEQYRKEYSTEDSDVPASHRSYDQFSEEEISQLKWYIDIVTFKHNEMIINGWAFINQNPFDHIYISFKVNTEEYSFRTRSINRVDINQKFTLKSNKYGFVATMQSYHLLGGFYPFSVLFVKDNKCFELKVNQLDYLKVNALARLRNLKAMLPI